jgi:hypothetical protein
MRLLKRAQGFLGLWTELAINGARIKACLLQAVLRLPDLLLTHALLTPLFPLLLHPGTRTASTVSRAATRPSSPSGHRQH